MFTINAEAVPAITSFSWTRKGGRDIPETSEAPGQRVTASGAALYMNNILEEDGGIYIVTAENKIGRSRKSFRVNVEFPPR